MLSPRIVFIACASAGALVASGWDRAKAFEYLETRQQQWAEWKPAQKFGGACISCHTGLSYLMARRVISERQPRPVERDLVQGVKTRLLASPPKTMFKEESPDAILSLLTLSLQRRSPADPLDSADRAALDRLWQHQNQEGEAKGVWKWFENDLHPVESEHSAFYAATLVELALSAYPKASAEHLAPVRAYMKREASRQPLHNRLAWIAFGSGKGEKGAVLANLWSAQAADGGWTSASLGPWAKREEAPPDTGSNAYATAWATFAASQAGAKCSDPHMESALSWLAKHQDRASGAWPSVSMNKVYPEGSMQSKFMTDAATGFAAAALIACKQ
ncbi:MAG: hypothetical protein U0Q16_28395 [Bryobacteraceae bacterium]